MLITSNILRARHTQVTRTMEVGLARAAAVTAAATEVQVLLLHTCILPSILTSKPMMTVHTCRRLTISNRLSGRRRRPLHHTISP